MEILFTLLVFILSKNLNALPIQLTLIACIKPISAFFAFYLSSIIFDRPDRIRAYLLMNNLVGCLPCLAYPYIENAWFYLASYAMFMITMRAANPAWLELLKRDRYKTSLNKTISQGTSIFYVMTILLAPLICFWMDQHSNVWQNLFVALALLSAMNSSLILLIPFKTRIFPEKPPSLHFLNPLEKGWSLLKNEPLFTHYQLLFFLGGVGIIASQPLLPLYFKDTLDLSFGQLGLAFSFCKGVSFLCTSPYWAKYAEKLSLYRLNSLVNLCTCLFFLFLLQAQSATYWLFLAYLSYGTAQAGSEMSWNLSGPYFSGKRDSTPYSGVNLALAGIRGCLCPFLGYLLFSLTAATQVFSLSAFICLISCAYGLWIDRSRLILSSNPQ